jgi:3-dehydroquinate synthase
MKEIVCKTASRTYSVFVGKNILKILAGFLVKENVGKKVLITSNTTIAKRYYHELKNVVTKCSKEVSLHLLPDGERAKSEHELFRLYDTLLEKKCDRHATMVAFGGGVIGDVSGFCASTYMRGINFVNLPTTLLAQVDSAIGGKTAINVAKGKNLIGTFYQPHCVISDISFLSSLPRRQLAVALAEVIKYGVIGDPDFFTFLEHNITKALDNDVHILEEIVYRSSAMKIHIVEKDEHETTGLRATLNFGHTFAHAFEALGNYKKISHGEAVALGMVAASKLAASLGICPQSVYDKVVRLIKKAELSCLIKPYRFDVSAIFEFMQRDKKNKLGLINLVLPTKIGTVKVFSDIPRTAITKTLSELF